MKDGNNMKERKAVALVAVVLMLMMVVQVPLSGTSDISYAASEGSPSIGNLSISAYDQDSTDYSLLPYMSSELPTQLNAAEWVFDDSTRLWYNVSSMSMNYGKTLKYGMISDISVAEIRSDIISFFSPTFTSSFTIIQVEYTIGSSCNVSLDIEKDGTLVKSVMSPMTMDRGGYHVVSSIQQSVLFSVANSANADINIADTKGEYTVTAKCNGVAVDSESVVYGGTSHSLAGKVVDAKNDPIKGAEVKYVIYSDDSTVASIVASGSKFTAADGTYTIFAKLGEVVEITEVVCVGLTFPDQTFSYGTVMGDVSPGHTFISKEHMVFVSVKDSSNRVAPNVPIKAAWYTSEDDGTGKYIISSSVNGIYCNSATVDVRTDSTGSAYIAVDASQMPSGAVLYVCSDICNYTFTTDSRVSVGSNKLNDLPAYGSLSEKGNVYVNTTTYDDVSIVADDYSVEVTVAGAKDGSLNGGAVLQDVSVEADWYYQMDSPSTGFCIRDNDSPLEPGSFNALIRGTAWLPDVFTNVQGKVIVCYTVPSWSSAGTENAFLYIRAVGGASSSPSALYAFDSVVPADGPKNIATLDSESDAAVAFAYDSVPGTANVSSDDVSYTIDGTVTGVVPESITVYCLSGTAGRFVVAESDGIDIEFSFTVKAGTSNVIEINAVDGYVFSNIRQSMPTATGDQTFTSVASLDASVLDRAVPAPVSKYKVDGVSAGDLVDLKFTVGGTACSITVVATSATVEVSVLGWPGNTIEGMVVTGTGLYIGDIVYDSVNGEFVAQAAPVVERKYVTYYDRTTDQPTIENVVGMQTIQVLCDGSVYTSAVSDQKGVMVVSVPDVATLSYMFGNLSVTASQIAGGAYDGYYAINLKEVIDPVGPKQVNVTVRYIATSSLQNTELPTNVDILNGPMDMVLDVGTTQTFEAPDVEGFNFSGWYLNGESVSDSRNVFLCSFSVTDDLEGAVVTASYSAETPEPPKEDIGTIIAIGMVSVTIALIALIYVILQIRRY